ncbi:MAG: DUF4058 family protein [Caldilineaceae bacterium]
MDLQAAFDDMYQRVHYADSMDYTEELPAPSVGPAKQQWVQQCIAPWLAAHKPALH